MKWNVEWDDERFEALQEICDIATKHNKFGGIKSGIAPAAIQLLQLVAKAKQDSKAEQDSEAKP